MSNHKRNFWIQHIKAWQQSGLSRPEYLKAHHLSASQFSYYYRNHFLEVKQVANDSKAAGLVQVQVVEDQPVRANPGACLTLSTPKGYRIELESGFDADLLQKVLRIVEAA
ncbi:IS66 family insertion sequence element accessory protein TnpA [Endozoicomonas atrinae]|uniref:IS66 family insertion sequence element accessory protein TnpA n=1 Tax=Endozoicomonas atrinae TaxID=1333660 RepID=UPI003B00891C